MTGEQESSSNVSPTPVVFSNEPPPWVYAVGALVGAASSIAFCSFWLTPVQDAVAAMVAGVAALMGYFAIENVFEGCFVLAITCLVSWMVTTHSSSLLVLIPFVIGISTSKMWVGVWRGCRATKSRSIREKG